MHRLQAFLAVHDNRVAVLFVVVIVLIAIFTILYQRKFGD